MRELKPIGFVAPVDSIAPGASYRFGIHLPVAGIPVGLRFAPGVVLLLTRVWVREKDLLPCPIPAEAFTGLLAEQLRPFVRTFPCEVGMAVNLELHNPEPIRAVRSPSGALLLETETER